MSEVNEVLVDPQRLLVVRAMNDVGVAKEILAMACSYIPMTNRAGVRRVAILVVTDPAEPQPLAPYYCPRQRFVRRLIAPARVQQIRPYMT